jgi:hypothetical protein
MRLSLLSNASGELEGSESSTRQTEMKAVFEGITAVQVLHNRKGLDQIISRFDPMSLSEPLILSDDQANPHSFLRRYPTIVNHVNEPHHQLNSWGV